MKRIITLLCTIACAVAACPQDNKLPTVYLTGDFGYDYQDATVSILMPDGSSIDNLKGVVKWRGGSTNTEGKHKRNYKIKLQEDQELFGMRSDNKWILDAGQADVFRLRNRIATELWNDMARKPYYADKEPKALTGVRGQVVEVYLNNEYRGIYCLTECMDRKQLKLKKFDKNSGEIHGGLWKSEGYSCSLMWECLPTYDNKSDTWDVFEVKYPELDDVEETNYSTLWNAINFVANSSDEAFQNEVADYFDIPVIIDYYIFLNTLNAIDNVGKNMFWAVYDKSEDKKLTPAVWDLDATTGAKWLGDWAAADYQMDVNLNLIVRLKALNVDNFNEKTVERYRELRSSLLSTASLISRYNDYYELLVNSGAAEREEAKWSQDSDVSGEVINFKQEIAFINDWITRHMLFLDTTVFSSETAVKSLRACTIDDADTYNLYGQKVKTPRKGIYIKQGKKYIAK